MDSGNDNLKKAKSDYIDFLSERIVDPNVSDLLISITTSRSIRDFTKQKLLNLLIFTSCEGQGLTNEGLTSLLQILDFFEPVDHVNRSDAELEAHVVHLKYQERLKLRNSEGAVGPKTLAKSDVANEFGLSEDQVERRLTAARKGFSISESRILKRAKTRRRLN